MYETVIKGAWILDGTGAEGYVADVALRDGKIAKIAETVSGGQRIIHAQGLTLTPGWIDSHSHQDLSLCQQPEAAEALEQGITFCVGGHCGSSAAPKYMDGTELSVAGYLDQLQARQPSVNLALFTGHNNLRRLVIGTENRAATPEELAKMQQILAKSLEEGAIGLSFGLTYAPGCYAGTSEMCALAETVRQYGGVLTAHIRNEGDRLLESVEEFLSVVKASGCPGVISHLKAADRANWGKVRDALAMVDQANAEGARVFADAYPYCASRTSLPSRFVPAMFHPAGTTDILPLLDDPGFCKKLKAWATEKWGDDLSWVLVTDCPQFPQHQGLDMNQIAEKMGYADRYDAVYRLIRSTGGNVKACFFMMCEEDVRYVLAHPMAMVCTDSGAYRAGTPYHPRLRGSFPRVLGTYVRRDKVATLPEMIRRFTSLPAQVYGLTGKGRIAEGYDADLCLFDSKTICDTSDYANHSAPNKGLAYVFVGGKIAVENNKATGIRNGKPFLRKSPK